MVFYRNSQKQAQRKLKPVTLDLYQKEHAKYWIKHYLLYAIWF